MTIERAAARLQCILSPVAPPQGLALRFHRHGVSHTVGGALHSDPRFSRADLDAARDTANAAGLWRLLVGPLGWIACGGDGEVSVRRRRGQCGTMTDPLESPVGTEDLARAIAAAMRGISQPVRFHCQDADLSAHARIVRARVLARIRGADADWLMEPMSMSWTAQPLRGAVALLSAAPGVAPVPVALSTS